MKLKVSQAAVKSFDRRYYSYATTNMLLQRGTHRSEDDVQRDRDVVVECVIINNTNNEEQYHHHSIRPVNNKVNYSLYTCRQNHLPVHIIYARECQLLSVWNTASCHSDRNVLVKGFCMP